MIKQTIYVLTTKGGESQRPKNPNAFVGRLGIAVAALPLLIDECLREGRKERGKLKTRTVWVLICSWGLGASCPEPDRYKLKDNGSHRLSF